MTQKRQIALVVGTRPEVIKLASIHLEFARSKEFESRLVSTGQHQQLLNQSLDTFGLKADIDLALMTANQTLSSLTSRVLTAMTQILSEQRPEAMLVQGDTTTVLAASLAAFYLNIPIGHVEAGLRTGNMRSPFPEEMNRRLTSPLARWHFCPTELSRQNLLREGIPDSQIYVTGNSVVDSLLWVRNRLREKDVTADEVAGRLKIPPAFVDRFLRDTKARWILVTGHRRESFGDGFERICQSIVEITRQFPDVGILYPVHLNPNVREPVHRLLANHAAIGLVEPAGYEDFVWLMDRCTFILSDSGGVQEEAPSLGKPVLVMRENTERPEGVDAGTCTLVGTDPRKILSEAGKLLGDPDEYHRRSQLKNPYGDGQTSRRIREILERELP